MVALVCRKAFQEMAVNCQVRPAERIVTVASTGKARKADRFDGLSFEMMTLVEKGDIRSLVLYDLWQYTVDSSYVRPPQYVFFDSTDDVFRY
jgi:hypothetical protein